MELEWRYYSHNLLNYITNQCDSYFKLDIMNSDVLLEPHFSCNSPHFEQDIKGELCNFLYLDQPEITYENIQSLVGHIVLYQYPARYTAEYHLRFVRILSVNKSKETISLTSNFISSKDVLHEKISNLRRRSSAYRIWIPTRLYIKKMVEIVA